jgi:hypothetical protein
MEVRLVKIAELILSCRYGFTDLSYATRLNMPLELGLLLAFGKETFVASGKRYGALRTISDLNFTDPGKRLATKTLLLCYRRLRRIRRSLRDDFDRLRPEEISKPLGVAEAEFRMNLTGP